MSVGQAITQTTRADESTMELRNVELPDKYIASPITQADVIAPPKALPRLRRGST